MKTTRGLHLTIPCHSFDSMTLWIHICIQFRMWSMNFSASGHLIFDSSSFFLRCPVWYLLGVHLWCVCISMFGTFATAECFVYCWTYRLEAVDEFNSIQSSRAHDNRSSFKIHRHYSKIHLFVFKLIHIGLTETIQFWTDSSSISFCARW